MALKLAPEQNPILAAALAADVVEINPVQDMQDSTSRLAVEFVGPPFGKRIIS